MAIADYLLQKANKGKENTNAQYPSQQNFLIYPLA
jgi:hypothetical protein